MLKIKAAQRHLSCYHHPEDLIRWSISTRRHPPPPYRLVCTGTERSAMERWWTFPFPCPAFTLQRGCRPVSVLPFIPLGKVGPLWHNERHKGLGLRRTQRPYELSSLSLPGGVACKQLAGRSTVFQSPSMCPAPWRKQNDSQCLMLTTGLSRNVYTPTFTSTTDRGRCQQPARVPHQLRTCFHTPASLLARIPVHARFFALSSHSGPVTTLWGAD